MNSTEVRKDSLGNLSRFPDDLIGMIFDRVVLYSDTAGRGVNFKAAATIARVSRSFKAILENKVIQRHNIPLEQLQYLRRGQPYVHEEKTDLFCFTRFNCIENKNVQEHLPKEHELPILTRILNNSPLCIDEFVRQSLSLKDKKAVHNLLMLFKKAFQKQPEITLSETQKNWLHQWLLIHSDLYGLEDELKKKINQCLVQTVESVDKALISPNTVENFLSYFVARINPSKFFDIYQMLVVLDEFKKNSLLRYKPKVINSLLQKIYQFFNNCEIKNKKKNSLFDYIASLTIQEKHEDNYSFKYSCDQELLLRCITKIFKWRHSFSLKCPPTSPNTDFDLMRLCFNTFKDEEWLATIANQCLDIIKFVLQKGEISPNYAMTLVSLMLYRQQVPKHSRSFTDLMKEIKRIGDSHGDFKPKEHKKIIERGKEQDCYTATVRYQEPKKTEPTTLPDNLKPREHKKIIERSIEQDCSTDTICHQESKKPEPTTPPSQQPDGDNGYSITTVLLVTGAALLGFFAYEMLSSRKN